MKSVIKIIRTAGILLALAAVTLTAPTVRADVEYFSTRAVLASFFPKSERVSYRTLALEGSTGARVAQRLGYKPALDRYTVFVALTQGHVDGYAVIDNEKGLHEPITFATKLTPQGIVEKVEIMVYREPRGDEVRDPRFRKQFEGRSAKDELRISHDLDAVSGATISSRSLAVGVRRATVLVEELISTTSKSTRSEGSNPPAPITTASR